MTAQIIYVCTLKYVNFAKDFFDTLHMFMPNLDKKVTVLTDNVELIKELSQNIPDVKICKYAGGPYPCVNLCKFANILAFMDSSVDYVFYFDADTKFVQLTETKVNRVMSLLNRNTVIIPFSVSLACAYHPKLYREGQEKYRIYDMELINTVNEPETSPLYDKLHITDLTYQWRCTSLIAAKPQVMKDFCELCNNETNTLLKTSRRNAVITNHAIPTLFDESVANKIIYDYLIGDRDLYYKFSSSVHMSPGGGQNLEYFFGKDNNIIVVQKHGNMEYKNHD